VKEYTKNAGEMLCPKGKRFLKLLVFLQTNNVNNFARDTGCSVSLKKCVNI